MKPIQSVFVVSVIILIACMGYSVSLLSDNSFSVQSFWFSDSIFVEWENPYVNWGKEGYTLYGGQGPHLHTLSNSSNPDAVIELKTIFQIFTEDVWPPSYWAERVVNVGGYENTNGGYELFIIGAHDHRRTSVEYQDLLDYADVLGEEYDVVVVHASEVYPPHEGVIWNGLGRGTLPNDLNMSDSSAYSKVEFVKLVNSLETDEYHSIAVILHPQAGGETGRDTIREAVSMVKAGAELLEIFNGGWETGDDLIINDHNRSGSTNQEYSRASGNSENYWDTILSQNLRVWGVGCDDFHGYRKGIDEPQNSHNWAGNLCWIEVLAREDASSEDIVRAIERGSFYVTQGVQIESITVEGDAITVVGDETVDFIEAIGMVGGPTSLGPLNDYTGDTGTLLMRAEGTTIVYKADTSCISDNLYVRFRLVNTDYDESLYFDEHGDGGGDVYAWTQPFYSKNIKRIN